MAPAFPVDLLALTAVLALSASHVRGLWRLEFLRYAPCFVPGVMAYALSKRVAPKLNSWLWPPFLLSVMAAFLWRASWNVAWIVCLVLGLSVVLFKDQTCAVVNHITHAIAKYSYGIYLGHTLCIWLAFWALRNLPWPIQWGVFVTLICAVPYVAFIAIERPGIEIGKRLAQGLTEPLPTLVPARKAA